MRKVYLISTFVAVLIGRFAWADASLTMDELREVIEVNPQMAFAKWAIKHPLDKTYAATTFQELSEGPNSELAGRRYAFVILHVPSKKVVLVLEEGKLEMGHNPHPAGGTDRRATSVSVLITTTAGWSSSRLALNRQRFLARRR